MISFILLAVAAQVQIPAPVGYVNDFAAVIDPESQRQMHAVIDEVRVKSAGEIVVVTLADLGGRPAIEVARDIGRQWRVGARGGPGDRARNAGVVLLLQPGQRPGDGRADLAVATGSGAEGFITDARAGRIRDAIGRVAVERGSYAGGLVTGVWLLAQAYAEEFRFELSGQGAATEPSDGVPLPAAAVIAQLVFFMVLAILVFRRAVRAEAYRRGYYRTPRGLGWLILSAMLSGGRGGSRHGRWRGGGFGGGGFGGFGGGGGFSGGGASGRF